ncbi:MAG: alpha-L-fucosidase [Phycisphaerae bacterium]|nr:alpha-L-fucosidase [Phycisphaerae bacterium]
MRTFVARPMALALLVGIFLTFPVASAAAAESPDKTLLQAADKDMQWWRDARFGLFVHWGPVSLKGTEIGWSRAGERRGRKDRGSQIPTEVYDNLYKQFNPTKFNADEWVAIAKAAGMKYIVFTTKHHDGFSMFDSKLTDYKITNSPYKRDIVAQLAEACHKAGLRLGFYYSPPDWHHPDYRTADHDKYIKYLHGQLRELCTNYGKVAIIWFDGLGGTAKDWDAASLVKMIRQLQPGVIINNRAGLPCDHDTPEQRIGKYQDDRPWESCITICHQWAWKPNDKLKSLAECVRTLVNCAGGDGNLLLNVGPMPSGEIEPRQVDRLKEMGAWMSKYGETIYGTRGGPFKPWPGGASTRKANKIYVHVFQWPGETLCLPPIAKRIVANSVLTGGKADVKQTPDGIEIAVPPAQRDPIDTIISLELDGPACDLPAVSACTSGSAASGKKARASNVYRNMRHEYGPDKAFDDDPATRWATDAGTHEAWIEVDLGKPTKLDRAMIHEAYAGRVQAYTLQAKDGNAWKTFHKGATIGENAQITFEPITAQVVRLNIDKATEGPTIWEIQLYPMKDQ